MDSNTKHCKLIIPGDPIPAKRPRACIRGKHASVYSDQGKEYRDFRIKVLEQITTPMFTGPLEVIFHFFMRRPKSHYGTGRNAGKLKKTVPAEHTKKPDTSNLIKFAEDALNDLAWVDDSQIVFLTAYKIYENGEGPQTIINIREV